MSKSRISTVSLILTGLASACSSPSAGSSGSIPFDLLPAKYAAAACAAYQNCLGTVFAVSLNGTDCTDLTTQRLENGTFALIQQRIDQGTIHYDGAQAQACIDAVGELTCDELNNRDQPACLAALDGTVALGGDCDLGEECKGSAICKSSAGTCPGKCVVLLSAGQACVVSSDCDDGLECSKETKLCVKPAVAGENCEYGSPPCGPGLLCLGKDDTALTPGICRNAKSALSAADGTACDPSAGTLCVSGVSCVAESYDSVAAKLVWTCHKSGTYKTGEACHPGFPEACSSGNFCKVPANSIDGLCTAVPDAKQTCGTGLGAQCKSGAVCVAGLCQNYAANGVSCTGDAMCYSEYCGTSGGCAPRLPCQ